MTKYKRLTPQKCAIVDQERRKVLKRGVAAAGIGVGLAGCSSGGEDTPAQAGQNGGGPEGEGTEESGVGGFVAMHEFGHSFALGEADDNFGPLPFSEVYSGSSADGTPELVRIRGVEDSIWSIMRAGWGDDSLIRTQNSGYYAFSVEELTTATDINA